MLEEESYYKIITVYIFSRYAFDVGTQNVFEKQSFVFIIYLCVLENKSFVIGEGALINILLI